MVASIWFYLCRVALYMQPIPTQPDGQGCSNWMGGQREESNKKLSFRGLGCHRRAIGRLREQYNIDISNKRVSHNYQILAFDLPVYLWLAFEGIQATFRDKNLWWLQELVDLVSPGERLVSCVNAMLCNIGKQLPHPYNMPKVGGQSDVLCKCLLCTAEQPGGKPFPRVWLKAHLNRVENLQNQELLATSQSQDIVNNLAADLFSMTLTGNTSTLDRCFTSRDKSQQIHQSGPPFKNPQLQEAIVESIDCLEKVQTNKKPYIVDGNKWNKLAGKMPPPNLSASKQSLKREKNVLTARAHTSLSHLEKQVGNLSTIIHGNLPPVETILEAENVIHTLQEGLNGVRCSTDSLDARKSVLKKAISLVEARLLDCQAIHPLIITLMKVNTGTQLYGLFLYTATLLLPWRPPLWRANKRIPTCHPSYLILGCCLQCHDGHQQAFRQFFDENADIKCSNGIWTNKRRGGFDPSPRWDSERTAKDNRDSFEAVRYGDQDNGLRRLWNMSLPLQARLYHHFHDYLASLLSQKDVEKAMDVACNNLMASIQSNQPPTVVADVFQAEFLRTFEGPSAGKLFVDCPGNEGCYVFALSFDFFRTEGMKMNGASTSSGLISAACLNLLLNIHYKPENMYISGIVPGPTEPHDDELNHYIQPFVNEQAIAWKWGVHYSCTACHPTGRLSRSAIALCVCNLPGGCRLTQIAGHSANHYCSVCNCWGINNIGRSDFDDPLWNVKSTAEQWSKAEEYHQASSKSKRRRLFTVNGIRWSPLWILPYWDTAHMLVVDSAHCLLEGLAHFHFREVLGIMESYIEQCKKEKRDLPAFEYSFRLPNNGDREHLGLSPGDLKCIPQIHKLLVSELNSSTSQQIREGTSRLQQKLASKNLPALAYVSQSVGADPDTGLDGGKAGDEICKADYSRGLINWVSVLSVFNWILASIESPDWSAWTSRCPYNPKTIQPHIVLRN